MKNDAQKQKYLQALFTKLSGIEDKMCFERIFDARIYSTMDYKNIATIQDLTEIQNEKAESKCKDYFNALLKEFIVNVPDSNFFDNNPLAHLQDSLTSNASSPIIALIKTEPSTRLSLLIDLLYQNPECNHQHSNTYRSALSVKDECSPTHRKKPKYQIVGRHICHKNNRVTLLPRYIFLHLILAMANHSARLWKYLACMEYSTDAILRPKNKMVSHFAKILFDFFDKLNGLQLTTNLVYIIENADNLDKSFYLALKFCKQVFPPFLKIILTFTKGTTFELEKLKMANTHNLVVGFTKSYIQKLCHYYIEKSTKIPAEQKEIIISLLNKESLNSKNHLEFFKFIWKSIENFTKSQFTKTDFQEIINAMPKASFREQRIQKVIKIISETKKYKHLETLEKILVFLTTARSPISIIWVEDWLALTPTRIVQECLSDFKKILRMNSVNISPDTVISLKHRDVWAQNWKPSISGIEITAITEMIDKCLSSLDNETLIDLPEYYRLNAVYHYSKIIKSDTVPASIRFLHPDWIYSQLNYFKSFDFVFEDFDLLLSKSVDLDITKLKSHLYLLQHCYENCELTLPDFATQIRSRLMNEETPLPTTCINRLNDLSCAHFKPLFPTLKENNNIGFIEKFDSEIIAVCLEGNYLACGTILGMFYVYSYPGFRLIYKEYIAGGIDGIGYIEASRFLIASGKYFYIWKIDNSPDTKNPEASIESNSEGTVFLTIQNNTFYAASKDNTVSKGTLTPLQFEKKTTKLEKPITAFLVANNMRGEGNRSVLVFTGHSHGVIKIFGNDLHWLVNIQHGDERIVSLQVSHLKEQVISVCADGCIKILDMNYYTSVSDFSIFDVTQEELVSAIYMENTGLLITIEDHAIRFYKLLSTTYMENWLYPFSSSLKVSQKSKDEKAICVGDGSGHLLVFTISKIVEQRIALGIPSHRIESPINFLLLTTALAGDQNLITCSGEREIKIWSRDTGRFIKKYSLASVARIFPNKTIKK